MILYPAIDLIAGRCVRLSQGRFDQVTTYDADPADALAGFAAAGATWAHVVDLDGARAGAPAQHDLVGDLARSAPLKLQVAGGIRSIDHVARLLDAGAARVVVGSLAVKDPDATSAIIDRFGRHRITLALDVRKSGDRAMVATHGWAEDSGLTLFDIADRFVPGPIMVTDIGRDGMLTGPNLDLISALNRARPDWQLQASGGVATLADLPALRTAGAAGAIVGKALWEGRFSLEEALVHARA